MYIFDVAARAEADILLPDYDTQKGWFGGEPEKQPGVSNRGEKIGAGDRFLLQAKSRLKILSLHFYAITLP